MSEENIEGQVDFYGTHTAPEKDLPEQERQRFWQEVEAEISDWARDETGNVVLTLYLKEAQRLVRERWFGEPKKA